MALTDITAFSEDWAAARAIPIPSGLRRRAAGAALICLAYGLWLLPVGMGMVTVILLKLWLSCFLLTRGLGLCLGSRGGAA